MLAIPIRWPTDWQGTHSFFAEAVISTDIDATELAKI